MTINDGLRAYLLAHAGIASIVGTRIYPLRLPQKTNITAGHGAIVLTRISDIGGSHLRGPNALSRARIQVDSWALTYVEAVALGTLCRRRIDGFKGTWSGSGSPPDSLQVQAIFAEDARDIFEEDILGGLCRQSTDYFVYSAPIGERILI